MATKVTLSSSLIKPSRLTDDAMNHDEPSVEAHDTLSSNYTTKRPPTPPKSKQPSLPSWKQHRVLKHKESNDYDRRSPEPFQSTNMNKSSSSNSSNSNSSEHTKSQQYLYRPQITAAESNKDYIQPPPPLLQNQSPGHLDEFFILQEQMDLTYQHRDQLMEENGLLKYHLHVLQYRLQTMESMWHDYCYYSRKKRASWASTHPQHLQQKQPHPYRPWIRFDYHVESHPPPSSSPPSYFMAPSLGSHLETGDHSVLEQQKDDDGSRHRLFRRQRSKSLPRNTSFSSMPIDNNGDRGCSLQQQPLMFPPLPPMFRPIPPNSARFQTFGSSTNVPPRFETKRYSHPPNNDNSSNNNSDIDDSDSEGNSVDDPDDGDLPSSGIHSQQSRHPRHHRYRTDAMVDSPPMPSSSYAPFPYQNSNADLSMGPMPPPPPPFMTDIPFGANYDFYPANGDDDDDDGWKQRPALPRYYNYNGNLQQQQQQQHRFDLSTKYPRQFFYGDPQQQQQQSYTSSPRHPPQRGLRNY